MLAIITFIMFAVRPNTATTRSHPRGERQSGGRCVRTSTARRGYCCKIRASPGLVLPTEMRLLGRLAAWRGSLGSLVWWVVYCRQRPFNKSTRIR
jgi:hypothetical protein